MSWPPPWTRVILEVRRSTGYTGGLTDGFVDPVAGRTIHDLRDAMNRAASYDPEPRYDTTGRIGDPPLNPVAPWVQWGGGFYAGWVANATVDHLLGDPQPPKSMAARGYMAAQHAVKKALYKDRVG